MLKTAALLTLLALPGAAVSQATATATRLGDGQVGVSFVNGNSDYGGRFNGFGAYADFDFRSGLGAEIEFNYISDPNKTVNVTEHTYEIGPRYSRRYGRFQPFVKATVGRGVFNFPQNSANLAYNVFAFGGGVDVHVKPYANVRGQYEYQHWSSFQPNGLTPSLLSLGVAYHFK